MALKFTKLTRTRISALGLGSRISEHGIVAEKTGSGDIVYRISIMVDGARISRTVGVASAGVTRTQAEKMVETYRTRAREGRLDLPKRRKTYSTFTEAASEYLARMTQMGGKDLINKRRHLNQHLIPFFKNRRINEISASDIAEYAQSRRASAKEATINRERSTLSHLFNRLTEWGTIKLSHKPKIVKGIEQRKPINILTDEQAASLMRAALDDGDPRLYLFVAFGLNAAMRHGEIVSVRYDQVDFDSHRIFIPEAKGGAREQPITPHLALMLQQRQRVELDPDGWVFPAKAGAKGGHRPSMEYGFKRAVIRAGLDPKSVTPHVMRHTAITKLVKAGVDVPTIQKISDHKTPAMVMRYVHIHGRHIDNAMAALNTGGAQAFT